MTMNMFTNYSLWILLVLVLPIISLGSEMEANQSITPNKFKVHFMEANSTYNIKPTKRGFFEKHLNTFCYGGEPKTLARLLETIEFVLEIEGDDYTQYDGTTPQEVEEHYHDHRSLFNFNLFNQKRSRLSLSPFGQQCIGIESAAVQNYRVHLLQQRFDYVRSIMLLCGFMIFMFAGILSTNSIFFYITGIVFGICSSFLFLIWLSGKLMPRRAMMYGVLIGGWTVGIYVIRMLWDNLQMIMMTYRNYVCWYIIITGLISFLLCYRWGPPKNRRSKNIIKWLLQLMSLALIYFSSNFKEAIVSVCILTIILYYFPRVLNGIMRFRGKKMSTKTIKKDRREFNAQMKKDLRDECNEWKLNSPLQKEWKIKSKPRSSINSLQRTFSGSRNKMQNDDASQFDDSNHNIYENQTDSDSSSNEINASKQKLYPLPDGSFLLSEKRPVILTPQQVTPIYHRSTPVVGIETDIDGDSTDCTPMSHQNKLIPAQSRRLTAASSTSELFVKCRRSTSSPSPFQRSSSVQRSVPSRASMMVSSAKSTHSSNPKIKIQKTESDGSESQ